MAVVLKIGRKRASFSRKQAASAVESAIARDAVNGRIVKASNGKKHERIRKKK